MNYFSGIIGYEHIKVELERIIDCINHREKYEALGARIPRNLLLYGDPGIGKTMFANAFLEAVDRKSYTIRKNKGSNDFHNEIEKIIHEAMDNAPSIVLLDDLDKFANSDEDHRNTDEFIMVQSLMDEAKDKDVYFIATANEIGALPGSLLRPGRFSTKIMLETPNLNDAALIVKHYLSDKKVADDLDYEQIAKILDGGSCALLEDVMNEAAILAGFNGNSLITMDDIIKASLRVIYDAPEGLYDKTKEEIFSAAYHEAGHVLAAELLEPGSVNIVSIANFFGSKGGITSQTNPENYWCDIEKMKSRVIVLLAGKAATEYYFHKIDVGCSQDLERASNILGRFFDDYGMADFAKIDLSTGPTARDNKDEWVRCQMKHYYQEALALFEKNRTIFAALVSKLIEKRILIRKDLDEIFAS